MIDPANGKVLIDKVIYTGSNEYMQYPTVSTGKGAYFKMIIRQSALTKKLKVALPGPFAIFSLRGYNRESIQTTNLQIMDFNEKLEATSTVKPIITNGTYISTDMNKKGDMFISWLNGPNIEVYKYEAGKTAPSNQMTVDVFFEENKNLDPSDYVVFKPSDNGNVFYYAMLYKNPDKEIELGTGILDFGANKKGYVTEVITKDYLKKLKKSFVPVNKDIDDVDLGRPQRMTIKYIGEANNKLLLALSCNSEYSTPSGGTYLGDYALIINEYNPDLQKAFQQVLPAGSNYPGMRLTSGYYINKNKLYIVANTSKEKYAPLLGVLDINTGKWDKMNYLSKKHMNKSDYCDGPAILWYGDNFLVPYFDPKGLMQSKYNVTLQQNSY